MNKFNLQIFIIVVAYFSVADCGKTVCKKLSDYLFKELNANDCYFDPDVNEPPEIIAKNHGYFVDHVQIITKEGYILDLYHLVHNSKDTLNDRPPIILQHGILTYGQFFMGIGKKSLAFVLLNKGYDVWLSNYRTIVRKNGHVNMTSLNPKYYDFSYQEIGAIDMPYFIDYIRRHNQSPEKVIYLGHSMGTTVAYVYSSLRPDHAEKNLKAIFNLASFGFGWHSRSILFKSGFVTIASILLSFFPIEYIYNQIVFYTGNILGFICYDLRLNSLCKMLVDISFGHDERQFQPEYFPNLIFGVRGWLPEVIKDFAQLYQNDRFFGRNRTSDNKELKDFPLDKIQVPIYIFQAQGDTAAVIEDAEELVQKLVNTKWKLFIIDKDSDIKFGHLDMLYGKHVDILYRQLFRELDGLQKKQ